jgi:hypothetical protein
MSKEFDLKISKAKGDLKVVIEYLQKILKQEREEKNGAKALPILWSESKGCIHGRGEM